MNSLRQVDNFFLNFFIQTSFFGKCFTTAQLNYTVTQTSSQDVGSKFVNDIPSQVLSNVMTSVLSSLLSLTSMFCMSIILITEI